jgi:hypothetical protein
VQAPRVGLVREGVVRDHLGEVSPRQHDDGGRQVASATAARSRRAAGLCPSCVLIASLSEYRSGRPGKFSGHLTCSSSRPGCPDTRHCPVLPKRVRGGLGIVPNAGRRGRIYRAKPLPQPPRDRSPTKLGRESPRVPSPSPGRLGLGATNDVMASRPAERTIGP